MIFMKIKKPVWLKNPFQPDCFILETHHISIHMKFVMDLVHTYFN